MQTMMQDVRFGLRMMAKSPLVTGIAVMSLALGIAANATMFSILNSFLFEPLPYGEPDRLVLLRSLVQGESIELAGGVSVANYRDLVDGAQSIESSTVYTVERANLTGTEVPEQLSVVVGTPSLLEVLGVAPALGRGFRPEEGVEGSGRVLVLEYDYWQARFLGDRDVLGRSVTLDGQAYTIVGVMPEAFDMIPANVHAFRPSNFDDRLEERESRSMIAFARLRDGATPDQLDAELEGPAQRLRDLHPEANRRIDFRVQPLSEFFPGPTDSQLLKILTAVTLFGLLIACANVANLLLGRAEERQREVAVRTAMGAGRHRIIRQMLTESVVMATAAGVLGSVLSVWTVGWLQGSMPPELPAAMTPELAPEVLAATLLVSMLAGVAFGLAPAVHAVAGNLRESLGNGARGGTAGRGRRRLRNVFVIGEVAVALALLAGSGFLLQAFDTLANADPGFDAEGLLTFELSVLEDRYPEDADLVLFERDLLAALGEIPGVEGVAVMSSLPRSRGNPSVRYTVDGRPVPETTEQATAGIQSVNATYFETLAIPLRSGRLVEEADREDTEPVAVVSEAFAAREFPGEDALGRRITVRGASREIVGVVGDITQERMNFAGSAGEQIYLPLTQAPLRTPRFALRTEADPGTLAADVRRAVWAVQPDQPVAGLRTLEDFVDESLAGPRAISTFLMVMGGIALALAAMGIYGVMAHSVAQQQREIGIRMALGAARGNVVGMVARSGLFLVGLGLLAGLPLTYLMYRGTVSGLGIFEADVGFGLSGALAVTLLVVAAVATIVPARRASGVAPVVVLRD